MSAVATTTGIPVDKQVLLITGGEALNPSDRVCNYSNAGTVSIFRQLIDLIPQYLGACVQPSLH
jgi:hypothetical protein